jgi:hypothetical protein
MKNEGGRIQAVLVNYPNNSVVLYEYNETYWSKKAAVALPERISASDVGPDPEIAENPFLTHPDFIQLKTRYDLITIDVDRAEAELLSGFLGNWSRLINGMIFTAVQNEGMLTVYRMRGNEL